MNSTIHKDTNSTANFLKKLLDHLPEAWLKLTTHRLDIYHEDLAKTEFLDHLEKLQESSITESELAKLPTAFDYIRLGHPLSCVLEWAIAKSKGLEPDRVISFASSTMPVLAILRKNKLDNINTIIVYQDELPSCFKQDILKTVYGYQFEISTSDDYESSNGCVVTLSRKQSVDLNTSTKSDFHIQVLDDLGSIITINENTSSDYIGAIQHVRRRETVAMTPADTLTAIRQLIGETKSNRISDRKTNLAHVQSTIKGITHSDAQPLIASSGLSIQYAIMMGLVHFAQDKHPEKPIKIIVPPNCYGGTNDQARRVAAAVDNVGILDLPVDGDSDMVQSTEKVLAQCAKMDAVPLIIAEIPTNPRVEVPDLDLLRNALVSHRTTGNGTEAVAPIFILDQTFCPNYNFLGQDQILSDVQTISYVSGSKFPSGGRCTAGYCTTNQKGEHLLSFIEKHLILCDNQATDLQLSILSEQMPSMINRIAGAYTNTRKFVNFIHEVLPEAKINFVSEALAAQGFTPSVFSLDLPTKGETPQQREEYKRELNLKLIEKMITEIPHESKYCVSYGQLKGSYWTIPATSTQGTTKEEDKDYIARVSLAPEMDLALHKEVFKSFVQDYIG